MYVKAQKFLSDHFIASPVFDYALSLSGRKTGWR
jgi:hypothetical protein